MGLTNRFFRIPRPRSFLYVMSLRTGTELSTLCLLFNKVSGFYGLLALLTGYELTSLQLSMYIYSLFALFLTVYLAPHIRTQSPFQCLALAIFFVLDTVINASYTAVFGVAWFLTASSVPHGTELGKTGTGPKGKGEGPEFKNVTSVEVAVGPDQGIPGEKTEAVTAGKSGANVSHGVLLSESISSVMVIAALWAVRVYLVLVVMSYARLVLRRHIAATSKNRPELYGGSKSATMLEDPFGRHLPEGKGWKGKLGRIMVSIGRGFWLGVEESDEGVWDDIGMGRLRRQNGEAPGVVERERRRRSGTGPPPPPPVPILNSQTQYLKVQERRDGK